MMTSLSGNAIGAKARAIYGKRLTTADYHELLRQRTVSDVAAYLKNTESFGKALSGISETQIHRGRLEVLLHRSRLEKYISLCRYDFTRGKGFYHFAILDVEISILLRAIMSLNTDSTQEIIVNVPAYLQEYASFDFMKLSKIRNFDDLLTVLSGTPYPAVLKRFSAANGSIDLSECEYALKCYYYERVLDSINKQYKGKTRKSLREIVLIEIEIANLSLIYRLKTYFHRTPEQIKQRLLPFYYRMSPRVTDELLGPHGETEFIEKMKLSKYSYQMKNVSYSYLENYTKHLRFIVSRKLIRFSTSAPVAFYSLMTLTQIELDNVTTIIEGIRYGNPSAEIEKLLILE